MDIRDISVPEIYKTSSDFRFFLEWIAKSLSQIQYDTDHLIDCYDPLKCKSELLWLLAETMGYKLDDRLPISFNRLVLLYFMSLIRNKGSRDGLTLAAEVNLAQFNILNYVKDSDILNDRLEDTSIPVNSAHVTAHPNEGYIDVVYFSSQLPVDSCTEYVRPIGMYMFQYAGVRVDANSRISVDARLTDEANLGESIGPTHVGHYSREDYARMQRMTSIKNDKYTDNTPHPNHVRQPVFYRNSDVEQVPDIGIDPGYRALYSLQLCNNENIVKSILSEPIFSLGFDCADVSVDTSVGSLKDKSGRPWNLLLDRTVEASLGSDVYVNDTNTPELKPIVNPVMGAMGDAIPLDYDNSNRTYTEVDASGKIQIVTKSDN